MSATSVVKRIMVLAGGAALIACSSDVAGPGTGEVESIAVSPAADSLAVGGTATLQATVYGANSTAIGGVRVFWSSEHPEIATVSDQGVVTAVATGATRIAASASGVSGFATITVGPKPVASIVLTPSSMSIPAKRTGRFQATTYDADGARLTGRSVAWSSSDTDVVTVDNTGLVTGVSPGSAVITATSGSAKTTAQVTVMPVPVSDVTVTPSRATLFIGMGIQLNAQTTDEDGKVLTGRTITWSTSNQLVAIVTPAGIVGATGAGTATITATSEGKTGTATILVLPVSTASVNVMPAETTIVAGDKATLRATVIDNAGKEQKQAKLSWSTSNSKVANVSDDGVVTALRQGTATITATSDGESGGATVKVVKR